MIFLQKEKTPVDANETTATFLHNATLKMHVHSLYILLSYAYYQRGVNNNLERERGEKTDKALEDWVNQASVNARGLKHNGVTKPSELLTGVVLLT